MSTKHDAAQQQSSMHRWLPWLMLLLFVLQPTMDVISYWLGAAGAGNTISLLLRFGILFFTALLGFVLSRRKRDYLLLAVVLLLFAVGHIWACVAAQYADPVYDLTNYIRVAQIPLLAFCFITFLREAGEAGYQAIEYGFLINFIIIIAVEVLSAVTGTNPYTYPNKSIGLLGWFYFANSQSAILSALVPVCLMQVIRKKKVFPMIGMTVLSFGVLYLFATRLTYLAIFVCAAGLTLVLLLSRCVDKKIIAVLLIGAAVCGATITVSPMYQNQTAHQQIVQERQQQADQMIAEAEAVNHTTVEQSPETCLKDVYELYLGGVMSRFGVQRVMEQYQYTSDVEQLVSWRTMKITFCQFLMEDAGTAVHLFGLELTDMIQDGETYDVENDFHGIYFLYGIVGLVLFVFFLLYFFWIIICALIRNFSQYFTLEAGAFGVSLCLLLVHVYYTAGVLRRPNASFYLSVVLAVIYYFVKIQKNTETVRKGPTA